MKLRQEIPNKIKNGLAIAGMLVALFIISAQVCQYAFFDLSPKAPDNQEQGEEESDGNQAFFIEYQAFCQALQLNWQFPDFSIKQVLYFPDRITLSFENLPELRSKYLRVLFPFIIAPNAP